MCWEMGLSFQVTHTKCVYSSFGPFLLSMAFSLYRKLNPEIL